jgi:hypothetical protein
VAQLLAGRPTGPREWWVARAARVASAGCCSRRSRSGSRAPRRWALTPWMPCPCSAAPLPPKGFSYEDAIIRPSADALRDVLRPNLRVRLGAAASCPHRAAPTAQAASSQPPVPTH